jgi:amino acid transporter
MARPEKASIFQRVEGLPIIVVFIVILLLFMYLAPEVFLRPFQYTTFLSTLPPVMLLAIGLTFIIGGRRDRSQLPRRRRLFGHRAGHHLQGGSGLDRVRNWHSRTRIPGFSPAAELIRRGGVVLALLSGVLIGFINGVGRMSRRQFESI